MNLLFGSGFMYSTVCGWACMSYTRPLLLPQPHPLIQIWFLLAARTQDGDVL